MNKRIRKVLRRMPQALWPYLPMRTHLSMLHSGDIDKAIIIAPQHRLVYTVIPKAANSAIKRYLWAACGKVLEADAVMDTVHRKNDGVLSRVADYTSCELRQILRADDWFRFTFVRNPYSRLISAYKDKILHASAVDHDVRWVQKVDPKATDPIPFRNFIMAICEQSDDGMNIHWRPQTALLMTDAMRYDHVGRVESFHEDMRPVIDHLNLPAEIITRFQREPINSRDHFVAADAAFAPQFDAELADIVHRRFQADFERFGYDPESWRQFKSVDSPRV